MLRICAPLSSVRWEIHFFRHNVRNSSSSVVMSRTLPGGGSLLSHLQFWVENKRETFLTRMGNVYLPSKKMSRALGHLCAHIGLTGPGEAPEDGEMIEMTLSSRHRIRNSSPGGLRPSTLPLGHGGSPQYWLSHVNGEETFLFLWNRRDREPNPELWRERQRC